MNDDPYLLLEVERDASTREIRSAYRRLAQAYHPDRNAAPDAAERFKTIAEAYAILSDRARRQAYDRWGQRAPRQQNGQSRVRQDDDLDLAFE
jgi:molecular chaperone DnaJ